MVALKLPEREFKGLLNFVQASKKTITHTSKLKSITKYQLLTRGIARIFQRGGHRGYSPAALPRVSAGSVVLSRHEGPY